MTKKQAPKKAVKNGKARAERPLEANIMAARSDDAMTRIAKAPRPPQKK